MNFLRDQDGTWSLKIEAEADKATIELSHASYPEALPRYITAFDLAFCKAAEKSEFSLVSTLLRVRGLQDAGWDPYETSLEAITQIRAIHEKIPKDDKIESFYAARHLQLWIYGHIAEASEPYEILANLIAVSQGDTFRIDRFPPKNGRPQSPAAKIDQLEKAARAANLEKVVTPLQEVWDRELRNAIFHSDYSVHGSEVRFRKEGLPVKYDHDEILTLVNRALAYLDALKFLHSRYIGSYTRPEKISVHPLNAAVPNEQAIVMVREGHGAIGLKHAWTSVLWKKCSNAARIPSEHSFRKRTDELNLQSENRAKRRVRPTPFVLAWPVSSPSIQPGTKPQVRPGSRQRPCRC